MIKVALLWLVVILALVQKSSHIVIQKKKACYFGKEEMWCFRHFLFIKTNLFCRFSMPFISSAAQLQSGQYVWTKIKRGIKIFLYLHCKFLTRVSKCNYLWVASKNLQPCRSCIWFLANQKWDHVQVVCYIKRWGHLFQAQRNFNASCILVLCGSQSSCLWPYSPLVFLFNAYVNLIYCTTFHCECKRSTM